MAAGVAVPAGAALVPIAGAVPGVGVVAAAAAPAAAAPAAVRSWVLAEMVDGHHIGAVVAFPAGAVSDGDWGLIALPNMVAPRPVLVRHLSDMSMLDDFCDERIKQARASVAVGGNDLSVGEDVRTLSVQYTADGQRRRNYRNSVAEMIEVEFDDFPLEGPRTTDWYVKEIAKMAEGPVAQHFQWLQQAKIPDGDRSVFEDEVLARILEVAVTYDALAVSNLASFEIISRRRQLIAEAHVGNPGAPSYEGASYFRGMGMRAGGALVAPSLAQHVSERMRADAAIAKERRKAREARGGGGRGSGEGVLAVVAVSVSCRAIERKEAAEAVLRGRPPPGGSET